MERPRVTETNNVVYLDVREVWAIDIGNGTLLPPIDDDFCDCFMAFPSREDAEKALQSQRDKDYVDEAGGKVVKIG